VTNIWTHWFIHVFYTCQFMSHVTWIGVRWEFVTKSYVWLICRLIDWSTYFIHVMSHTRMWHDMSHDTNIPWLILICLTHSHVLWLIFSIVRLVWQFYFELSEILNSIIFPMLYPPSFVRLWLSALHSLVVCWFTKKPSAHQDTSVFVRRDLASWEAY